MPIVIWKEVYCKVEWLIKFKDVHRQEENLERNLNNQIQEMVCLSLLG